MKDRFIADAMLGKLSRWMRFIGLDVLYIRDVSDSLLLEIARKEGRTILTRDTRFYERFHEICIFIEGDRIDDQLRSLLSRLQPFFPEISILSRCSVCNGILKRVEKEDVRNRVPAYTFKTQNRFMLCEKCQRIYWPGTHRTGILKKIKEIFEEFGLEVDIPHQGDAT